MWYRLFNIVCCSSIFFCLWAYGFYNHEGLNKMKKVEFTFSINTAIWPFKSRVEHVYFKRDSKFNTLFYEPDEEFIVYCEVLIKPSNTKILNPKLESKEHLVKRSHNTIMYVNPKTLNVDTSLEIKLLKGSYDFYLLFDYQGIQYAARSTHWVKAHGSSVHFNIYPVLGETLLNVHGVKKLASYKPPFMNSRNKKILARQLNIKRLKNSQKMYTVNSQTNPAQVYINLPKTLNTLNSVQLR